jgi:putative copper resistance protein D
LGGLLGLFVLLTPARSGRDDKDAIEALRGFAGTGSIAVATLIGTGIINTALLVGSIEGMVSTTYGRLLLCKLALFIAMLSLAAANRFAWGLSSPGFVRGGTPVPSSYMLRPVKAFAEPTVSASSAGRKEGRGQHP